MASIEHKRLLDAMVKLNDDPADNTRFADWILAGSHLSFLRNNAIEDEIVVHAASRYVFVHSVVVKNGRLFPIDIDDILNWSGNPYHSATGYVTSGASQVVRVGRGNADTGSKSLDGALPLVFGRTFEGWTGQGRSYFEVNQEYSHIADIHWRPERRAYCRYDGNGDLESVVGITDRDDKESSATLVSFLWRPLEEYLVASRASLVRMFDFTLYRRSSFSGWGDVERTRNIDSDSLFYDQGVLPGHAAYTRGVQIVKPRRSMRSVYQSVMLGVTNEGEQKHAEFLAHDWRNDKIVKISTDPRATTNYFDADKNSLPFELSPAYFRPEVLQKYKLDRDKYTIGEREVSCRAGWHLDGIDVNEAGQVHAYICDLRRLPFSEMLHWLSFNERPKAGLSERAVTNDFKGEWTAVPSSLQSILSTLREWKERKVKWWSLRDERLLDRVAIPISDSRDEWSEAFMDLAKLVIEGFQMKPIRAELTAAGIAFDIQDGTILLLEKLLTGANASSQGIKLTGLRVVQLLRSKAKGHSGGQEAEQLAHSAIEQHETYGNHFRFVCKQVIEDLEAIEHFSWTAT